MGSADLNDVVLLKLAEKLESQFAQKGFAIERHRDPGRVRSPKTSAGHIAASASRVPVVGRPAKA